MAKFCLFDQFLFLLLFYDSLLFCSQGLKLLMFNIVCGPGKSLIGIDQK